mgnify:FL=1
MTPQELEAEVLRYALRNGSDRLGLQAAHKIAQLAPALLDLWRAAEEEREAKYSYLDACMGGVANEHDEDRRMQAKRNVDAALARLREVKA